MGFDFADAADLTAPLSGGGTGIGIAAGCSEVSAGELPAGKVGTSGLPALAAADGTGIRMGRREATSWVPKAEAVAVIGKGAGMGDRDLACLTTTVVSGISLVGDGARVGSASAG